MTFNSNLNSNNRSDLETLGFADFFVKMRDYVGGINTDNVVVMVCDGNDFVESVNHPLLSLLPNSEGEQLLKANVADVDSSSSIKISVETPTSFKQRLEGMELCVDKQNIVLLKDSGVSKIIEDLPIVSNQSFKFR